MTPLLVTDTDAVSSNEGMATVHAHGGPVYMHPQPYPSAPGPIAHPMPQPRRNRSRFHRVTAGQG